MQYWWVNIRKTYELAIGDGFMWCPAVDVYERALWHWQNMHFVEPGDVVFANSNKAIRAVGVATSRSRDAARPQEGFDFDWQSRGWRVDVEFRELESPLDTSSIASELIPLRSDKYDPLTSSGRASQTYLSRINFDMAAVLLAHLDPAAESFLATRHTVDTTSEAAESDDSKHEQDILITPTFADPERSVLIQARRGQGQFRKNVERFESACKVTGVAESRLLHASHIKPWRISNPAEKLDGENGLLLSPHVHTLFDQGLITFSERGSLITADSLRPTVKEAWAIRQAPRFAGLTERQAAFMEFHRDVVFAAR